MWNGNERKNLAKQWIQNKYRNGVFNVSGTCHVSILRKVFGISSNSFVRAVENTSLI
jgi:hypothetical protein